MVFFHGKLLNNQMVYIYAYIWLLWCGIYNMLIQFNSYIYILHSFTLRIPLHCTALLCIALHYITYKHTNIQTYIHTYLLTVHYIALHYITLHYNALHYITLYYITVQYITYICIHVYIYIYDYILCNIYIYTHMWYMYCIWSGWWLSHRSPEIVPNGTLRSFGGISHFLQWLQNQNMNSNLIISEKYRTWIIYDILIISNSMIILDLLPQTQLQEDVQ